MKVVSIRFASPHEQRAALQLASDIYLERGYVKSLQPLDGDDSKMFLAALGSRIIGTASVVMRLTAPLPTENYYRIDAGSRRIAEVGRLAVKAPDQLTQEAAVIGLISAVQLWADANGVSVALASLKTCLRLRLRMLGIFSEVVAGPERLDRDAVPQEYWGYFFPERKKDRPIAVTIDFNIVRAAILHCLETANGRIEMDPQFSVVAVAS